MGITFILSSAYMWWTKVPDFPLGARSVRGWLTLRAAFGFGGLYCLYCEFSFGNLTMIDMVLISKTKILCITYL